jgi:hypothetical protein
MEPAMTDKTNTATRRGVLVALAGTAAFAGTFGTAIAAPAEAATTSPEWERELAAFRKVEAAHDEIWSRWERAEELLSAAGPERIDRYFDDYKLGIGMKREAVVYRLKVYAASIGEDMDIEGTADAFMTYQSECTAQREKFRTDAFFAAGKAHQPTFNRARDALMEIPAPNTAALLVKIEIAAASLDDDHAEAMLADARRLLGGRA